MNINNAHAIVADIGGTHARFACVDLDHLTVDKVAVYSCTDFPCITHALAYYQEQENLTFLKHAAIAIACPIISDSIQMTNTHWQFSMSEVKKNLRLEHLEVINDFTAQAMCLPALMDNEKIQIGGGCVDPAQSMVVLGAGTGLGVAHLISVRAGFIPLPGEGGHTSWAAQTEQEWFIQRYLTQQYGHVSSERLLSGPGLENIYQAIAAYRELEVPPLGAKEIVSLVLAEATSQKEQESLARSAVNQFFASLGSYAGDLALVLSTFGGVYISGGIVPKLLPLMQGSEFRARFEDKGRFSQFNQKIPTYVVAAQYPGLLGAGVYLKQRINKETHVIF